MRKARLLSTVAATLLLTVGIASAQTVKKDEAPARAPAAQQKAPAEKVAPALNHGAQNTVAPKAHETTGQAPKASDADKTRATDKGAMEHKGAMDKESTKSSSERKGSADSHSGGNMKPKTEQNAQGAQGSKSSQSTTTPKSGTTGQGAAAGRAKLTPEQHTKITSAFKQHRVESVHLNVSVSVGTRVPETVHFYPIPTEVVVIYPEWRGYDYIMVGDQIVIIDPGSHEIVAVIDA